MPGDPPDSGDVGVGTPPVSRRSRRASRPGPVGSDPEPHDPPLEARSDGENDERLRADRPPHWDQGA